MSSREIAELLGTRHDHVKVSIERLATKGVFVQPAMRDEPGTDRMGRPRPTRTYLLDKRSSLIVVAQLSPEFTARVVDRWQELEERVATYQKAMNTFDEAEILRRIGGVVKAVTGRQIADLRDGVEAALETIGRLAQELRAAKSAAAPTFDLAGTVTSRDVMDMAGIRPETRVRGTGLIITRHLKTYCLERGLAAFRTPTEIDVYRRWRFPREAAADWVTREQGGEIIRNHIATSLKRKGAKGQGLLHLVPTEKH